jgi:hypothetical protein
MKHFNELDNVETQIIRLGEMTSLLAVIANGVDASSADQLRSVIHYIEGSIDDIHTQLAIAHQSLFNSVKDDQ